MHCMSLLLLVATVMWLGASMNESNNGRIDCCRWDTDDGSEWPCVVVVTQLDVRASGVPAGVRSFINEGSARSVQYMYTVQ